MVKSAIHKNDQTIPPYQDNSTLTFDISNLQNFENFILLYEDQDSLNNFSNREEFLKQYENNVSILNEKQKTLKKFMNEEINRINIEYEFKNYEKRFKIDQVTILCCLVGAKITSQIQIKKK
jgi:hypothetical protein